MSEPLHHLPDCRRGEDCIECGGCVEMKLEHNDDPRSAYYQFAMSWDEALEMDRTHGGDAWRDCLPEDVDIP